MLQMREHGLRVPVTWDAIFLAAVLFVSLGFPTIFFALNGVSLTGVFEESVGYRYFYSLRILYGDERPWLPQGQMPGLLHLAIQLALSALGYPRTELFPRIDIFTYAAALVPHMMSAAAFLWATTPLRSASARLLLAAGVLAATFYPRGFYEWVALPDYQIWVIPISLISIGALFRLLNKPEGTPLWRTKSALWLGVFAGLCVATKPTFIVFPIAIGCTMLWRDRRHVDWVLFGGLATLFGAVIWFDITAIYYLGDIREVVQYLIELSSFVGSQHATLDGGKLSLIEWLDLMRPTSMADTVPLLLILPALSLAVGSLSARSRVLLAILPANVLSLYVLFQRFYSHTLIEAYFFALVVAAFMAIALAGAAPISAYASSFGVHLPKASFLPSVLRLGLAVGVLGLVWRALPADVESHLMHSEAYNVSARQLQSLMNEHQGITAFLTTGNAYRPRSVDSAICKGGTDIFVPKWGVSSFIASMFPNRVCYLFEHRVDPTSFTNAVFVRLPEETREAAIKRVEQFFSMSLSQHDCSTEIGYPGGFYVFCRRSKRG